jgi:hypothetical protein
MASSSRLPPPSASGVTAAAIAPVSMREMLSTRGSRRGRLGTGLKMQERNDRQRCPVCGKGVFTDVVYEDREPDGTKLRLTGDSYEVLLFSCGHEVRGTGLATADADRLTVEARDSEEATDPVVEPENEPKDEPQDELKDEQVVEEER